MNMSNSKLRRTTEAFTQAAMKAYTNKADYNTQLLRDITREIYRLELIAAHHERQLVNEIPLHTGAWDDAWETLSWIRDKQNALREYRSMIELHVEEDRAAREDLQETAGTDTNNEEV